MELNRYIDHTILKADSVVSDIDTVCSEALEYSFASVCVNGCHVPRVAEALKGSSVACCTVVGFPLGAMSSIAKTAEAEAAVRSGADEIDMVINISFLKDGRHDLVREEIAAIRTVCGDRILKVILETCYLTDAEKKTACEISVEAGADFVKTSTGFGTGGATLADVALMKRMVGDRARVKASGGIRDRESALKFIEIGAERLGTSSGLAIIKGNAGSAGNSGIY